MLLELFKTLDSAISDLTTFLGIEHLPLSAMEFLEEVKNEVMMHKVHESVTYIGLIFVVNWDIEEVILSLVVLVNFL